MSEPSLQARSRHIRFSSTVSETFSFKKGLSDGIVKAAEEFWRSKGLSIKHASMPEDVSDNQHPLSVEFVAEGGTIWTTNFESYKKTVTVNMHCSTEQTEVLVQMVLPGGLMSIQDRERAASLIESFYDALERCNSG